jgi:hypothetical protein
VLGECVTEFVELEKFVFNSNVSSKENIKVMILCIPCALINGEEVQRRNTLLDSPGQKVLSSYQ